MRTCEVVAPPSSRDAVRRGAQLIERCTASALLGGGTPLDGEPSGGSTRAAGVAGTSAVNRQEARRLPSAPAVDGRMRAVVTVLLLVATSALSVYDLFLLLSLVVP